MAVPEFEFNEGKSRLNREKHGIAFEKATVLWEDSNYLEIPARTEGEARLLVIGSIDGKVWSAVVTPRGENNRIVSVRRARREEVELYENKEIR